MSSITNISVQLIILINNILWFHFTTAVNQCEFSSALHLQTATYIHSFILRVQSIHSSEQTYSTYKLLIRKVLVREVIKKPSFSHPQHQIKINDMIIIRINDEDNEFLNDSCWHLLQLSTVDVIIFLNETNSNEFDLHYPPVESTLRIRQHIAAVLNSETYSPQVLIKTRLDNAIVSKDYSLQCNSRGNPLPRLFWSKTGPLNDTLEYYPLAKQCSKSCRIYFIQNKYQSILYFQNLTLDDRGIYVCHAENPMNQTRANVYLNIDDNQYQSMNKNTTCASLKYCHHRGQCIIIDHQFKCLCDNRYFGEQCETSFEELITKQDNAMLLFKSRFLANCILISAGILLLLIALISWFLARNNRQQRRKIQSKLPVKTSTEKPLISPVKELISPTEPRPIIPTTSPIKATTNKPLPPLPPPPPLATVHISHSPLLEKKPLTPPLIRRANIRPTITRESSTATDDDDDGINTYLHHYQTLPPVPTKIDEEYEERFSLKMNKSEELGLGSLTNGIHHVDLILSHGYTDFYQPDTQTGLIKPLNISKDPPQRYTKYVSSYSKFVLPRPVVQTSSSSLEYQPR